jgi:hypothetical protein
MLLPRGDHYRHLRFLRQTDDAVGIGDAPDSPWYFRVESESPQQRQVIVPVNVGRPGG